MEQQEKKLTEKESLELIATMINKAKDSYHSTGVGAMMWGAVIAICSFVKLSEIQFGYQLPFDIYLLTLAAIVPQVFLTIREKKERKVKSYDDSYMDYIWMGFGISIFLLIHIINLVFRSWGPVSAEYNVLAGHPSSFRFGEFISPLFLMLYGLPTFITGAACRFRPMLWGGIFCWLCSIATVYTSIRIDLLLTASSAIVAWFIPGLIMEKEYRRYKKEQASQHV
ncbi:MAG: hypothetical protein HZB42_02355 [Sphingobacteriales bacterium]|nr:hypothetical protein [Sphingobacteriales bacterium]